MAMVRVAPFFDSVYVDTVSNYGKLHPTASEVMQDNHQTFYGLQKSPWRFSNFGYIKNAHRVERNMASALSSQSKAAQAEGKGKVR